jgi:hypothetical protein
MGRLSEGMGRSPRAILTVLVARSLFSQLPQYRQTRYRVCGRPSWPRRRY